MDEIKKMTKNNILFSYQSLPVLALEDSSGGFSFTIYGDGELRYCSYKGLDEMDMIEVYHLSEVARTKFCEKLLEIEESLNYLPQKLDNGSEGGFCQEFSFLEKKIIQGQNIKRTCGYKTFIKTENNVYS